MFLEFKVKCKVQDNDSSILSADVCTCTFTDILFIVYVNQSLGLLKVKQWSFNYATLGEPRVLILPNFRSIIKIIVIHLMCINKLVKLLKSI